MKKRITGVVCLMTVLMVWGITAGTCRAAQHIVVTNIQQAYVEKGQQNVRVTMRADVTNKGPSESVVFDIVGVDKQGYQHQDITFTGNVPVGKTRALMKMVTMPREIYDQIVKWELKK